MLHVAGPAIPYEGYFQGAVQPGFCLVVAGQAYLGSSRFSINLCCGKTIPGYPQPEIALHLNARFDQQCLARNSMVANQWGLEERSNAFPLYAGTTFQVMIKAESHQFNIVVNGNPFATYKYRIPLNRITTLRIHGEIIVQQAVANGLPNTTSPFALPLSTNGLPYKAAFPDSIATTDYKPPLYVPQPRPEDVQGWPPMAPAIGSASAPFPQQQQYTSPPLNNCPPPPPPYTPPIHVPTANLLPGLPAALPASNVSGLPYFLNSPAVPLVIHIPGRMRPGMMFAISGTPWKTSKIFRINFKLPNDDTAFHMSVRFSSWQVVRNSRRRGRWEREESGGVFPFARAKPFHLLVTCRPGHYDIMCNSRVFTMFQHRIFPVDTVSLLEIDGEVTVHMVNITSS